MILVLARMQPHAIGSVRHHTQEKQKPGVCTVASLLCHPFVKVIIRALSLKLDAASGVFAARSIRRGDLVEEAHCIYIPKQEYDQHLRQAFPRVSGPCMTVRPAWCISILDLSLSSDVCHDYGSSQHVLITRSNARHTILEHYLFSCQGGHFLALGVGSLFNHSYRPCLDFRVLRDQLVITYTAAREIKVGCLRLCTLPCSYTVAGFAQLLHPMSAVRSGVLPSGSCSWGSQPETGLLSHAVSLASTAGG